MQGEKRERGGAQRERETESEARATSPHLHSVEMSIPIVMPSSFPLCPLSLMSFLYLTTVYVSSSSPRALALCSSIAQDAPAFLADTVHSRCFATPAVTLQPGYTIRSSLLANARRRRRQTKSDKGTLRRLFFFFLAQPSRPRLYHFISLPLSPGTF